MHQQAEQQPMAQGTMGLRAQESTTYTMAE